MVFKQGSMENLVITDFWKGKKVLITGHTGFKGSWLSLWLSQLEAEVYGVSLAPESQLALFNLLNLNSHPREFGLTDLPKAPSPTPTLAFWQN